MSESAGQPRRVFVLPALAVLALLVALIGSWVSSHTEPEHLPVAVEPPRAPNPYPVAPVAAARPPAFRPPVAQPPPSPPPASPPPMQAPPPAHVASVPASAPIPAVMNGPPGPVIAPPPPPPGVLMPMPRMDGARPEEGGGVMKWRYQPPPNGEKRQYPLQIPPPGMPTPAEGQ